MLDWAEDEARFASPTFSADQFVAETFNALPAAEAERVAAQLREKRGALVGALVTHVQRDYRRFYETARETGAIEAELRALRAHFGEWHACLASVKAVRWQFDRQQQRSQPSAATPDAPRRREGPPVTDMELELDVLLSERRLEAAVALIEQQSRARTAPAALVAQVVAALTLQLTSSALSIQETRQVVDLLRRLQQDKQARHIFLEARHAHIASSVRRAEGTPQQWLRTLTERTLAGLRGAAADYALCFDDGADAAATLVQWVATELAQYGERWGRVVRGGDVSREAAVAEALAEAHAAERELRLPIQCWTRQAVMAELGRALQHATAAALDALRGVRDDCYATPVAVAQLLDSASEGAGPAGLVQLTAWAVHATRLAARLAADHHADLDVARAVTDLLAAYYQLAWDRVKDTPLNDQQLLGLLGNAVQLTTVVAPALDAALGGRALREYAARQQHVFVALVCTVKAGAAVHRSWQLSHTLYAAGGDGAGAGGALPAGPTRQALKLFEWLRTFRTRLAAHTGAPALAHAVAAQLVAGVVAAVRDAEEPLWRHVGALPGPGIVQLVLDLRWIQEAAAQLGWSDGKLARQLDALAQQAVLEHCVALRLKSPAAVLPGPDWFRDTLAPPLAALAAAAPPAQ